MPTSALRRIAVPLVLLFALSGLSVVVDTATAPPAEAGLTRAQKARKAVRIGLGQVGDRYGYGAAGPHRFDCSGLTYFSYRRAGFSGFPRTSGAQASFARRIKRSDMRRGDLMFFHSSGRVYHVAIFLGWKNGRRLMLHSPRSGERVKRAYPWTSSWFPGTPRR